MISIQIDALYKIPDVSSLFSMSSALVFLKFLITSPDSVSANGTITERVISRADLLEIAPDREDALMGHSTTEELRQTLRLHSTSA